MDVIKQFLPRCNDPEGIESDTKITITDLNKKYFDFYLEFNQNIIPENIIDSLDTYLKKIDNIIFWSDFLSCTDLNIDFEGISAGCKTKHKILNDYKILLTTVTHPCFSKNDLNYADKIFQELKENGLGNAIKCMVFGEK